MSVALARVPRPAPAIEPAAILGALPVPVILLDPDDRFRYANSAAEQFLGVSVSQLGHMRLADLLPEDNPLFGLVGQVRRTGATIVNHELSLESPRLSRPRITVQASPLPEDSGCVVLVVQDPSAARALDRQLTVLGAGRSVTGMAAMLGHELKNPLSGIRGAAQLLEQSVPSPDRDLAVLIRDEADRIRALVDRMEVFGDRPIERGAVNIHRVLERVRRLAETGFARSLRIAESYDPSLPPVWGNRDQLVQVLLNLVKNAAEACGGRGTGGEIVLSTAYHQGLRLALPGGARRLHLPLLVSVRDNGPGIPEDIRPCLFEPFITSKRAGTGLGLALVAKIVGDHGGLVEVESRPGRTEFRLLLPRAPAGLPEPDND